MFRATQCNRYLKMINKLYWILSLNCFGWTIISLPIHIVIKTKNVLSPYIIYTIAYPFSLFYYFSLWIFLGKFFFFSLALQTQIVQYILYVIIHHLIQMSIYNTIFIYIMHISECESEFEQKKKYKIFIPQHKNVQNKNAIGLSNYYSTLQR